MVNYLIRDYKIRCYNLQNKITPYKAEMRVIEKWAAAIKKKNGCDELTAYKILKKRLENKAAKKS